MSTNTLCHDKPASIIHITSLRPPRTQHTFIHRCIYKHTLILVARKDENSHAQLHLTDITRRYRHSAKHVQCQQPSMDHRNDNVNPQNSSSGPWQVTNREESASPHDHVGRSLLLIDHQRRFADGPVVVRSPITILRANGTVFDTGGFQMGAVSLFVQVPRERPAKLALSISERQFHQLRDLRSFVDYDHLLVIPADCIDGTHGYDLSSQCTICQESYIWTKVVYRLGCGHAYHSDCLLTWIAVGRNCPLCRTRIV